MKAPKGYYYKDGYLCKKKEYKHTCKECGCEFISYKTKQDFCGRTCLIRNTIAKNRVNDNSIFNSNIDDEFKAYMLGYIITDGSIGKPMKSTQNRQLNVTSKDFEFIEMLNNKITPTKKIYEQKGCYSIISNNQEDVEFLLSLGLSNNKTYIVGFDYGVREDLVKHYLRGTFDGDGCVYISKTKSTKNGVTRLLKYMYISFTTGSEKFAKELSDFLNSIGIENKINIDSRRKNLENKTYYVCIKKTKHVRKFYNYIYDDATIYLKRKRDVFEKFYNDDIVE